MRTQFTSKPIIATAVLGAGLLLVATPAFALSVPGYSGKAIGNSCFSESNGAAFNQCGVSELYDITLAVNSGPHTVSVSAFNAGGGTFQCTLYAASQTGVLVTGTSVSPLTGTTVNS